MRARTRASALLVVTGVFLLLGSFSCSDEAGVGSVRDVGVDTSSAADLATDEEPGEDAGEDTTAEPIPDVQVSCDDHFFEDVQVPLRDDKWLAAFVRRPTDDRCQLPTILIQTPYDKEGIRHIHLTDTSTEPLFSSMEYAFVVTDWRGFNGSSEAGSGGMNPMDIPYGRDGYDTVEWIAAQPWSDGQVGTWGLSALGLVQYYTALLQPPHLVASVPICTALNNTYESLYPGGVLRREYFDFINTFFGGLSMIADHPLNDQTWDFIGNLFNFSDVQVPMLVMGGWYDINNPTVMREFAALVHESDPAVREQHRLLIGDWQHYMATRGWSGTLRPLTDEELPYSDPDRLSQIESLAFFDLHLRGIQNEAAEWPPVRFMRSGHDTWESADTWPPEATSGLALYLTAEGTLATAVPDADEIAYPYDPDDPSPTIGGCTLDWELLHGPQDQADVVARDDAVVFVSEPLEQPLAIAGHTTVDLAVRTTGVDTDVAVRLTDVDEEGNHLMIGDGIQRLKLRDSTATPADVVAGERYELTVGVVNEIAYTFDTDHRVGLIVTSSNFPRFDRNPNTGADFYDDSTDVSLVVTNTLVLDGFAKVVLPVEE